MKKITIRLNNVETLQITMKGNLTSLLVLSSEYSSDEGVSMPVEYEYLVDSCSAIKKIEMLKKRHTEYNKCTDCPCCIQNYPKNKIPGCFKMLLEDDIILCENSISEDEWNR